MSASGDRVGECPDHRVKDKTRLFARLTELYSHPWEIAFWSRVTRRSEARDSGQCQLPLGKNEVNNRSDNTGVSGRIRKELTSAVPEWEVGG